jgi:hypothetical protein
MEDIIAQWEKLRANAAECASMKNLATDKTTRDLFALLAEQLGVLASEVERVITDVNLGKIS